MPRVKQTAEQELDNITRGCILKGEQTAVLSDEQIATKLHFTSRTYRNKKKRPETFTLGEFRKLVKMLKLTELDLKEMFGL